MIALLRLELRRLRSERLAALAFVALVFVTAMLLVLGPRLLERLSNEALVSELQSAPPVERNIIINESSRPSAEVPETADAAKTLAASLAQQLPPDLASLVDSQRFVADSTSWEVISGTQFQSLLFLRAQQDIEQHVELVDGRVPAGHTQVIQDPRPNSLPSQRATIYEVMLSQATAQEMGVTIGQDLPLVLSQLDRRNSGVDLAAVARVVGIYRISAPDDPFFLADALVSGYRFHPVGSNTVYVESDAILATDAYGALEKNASANRLPLAFQWRYDLDVTRIDASRSDQLIAALRRLDSHVPHSGVSDIPTDTTLRSGLLRLMEAHEARWESARALLSVVGIGALFVAATCLALVALLASTGRRRTSALALARGAGGRWVRAVLGSEGLLLSVPAVALALLLAVVIVPAASVTVSLLAGALVVLLAVALIAATGVPAGGPAAARTGGEQALPRLRRISARRLVAEAALVGGAIVGAVVLRERGIAGIVGNGGGGAAAGTQTSTVGADPLMVAVPALVGLAAGVLALRLYPLLTGLAARLSGWRRGLVFALASRRAARARSSSAVLVTIIATASVAGFAGAGWTTLQQAAENTGWQQVGAPFRVTSTAGPIPPSFDAAHVPGVTAVAPAWTIVATVGGQQTTLIAVDARTYQQMTGATPADQHLGADMVGPLAAGADAVPAIASTNSGLRPGTRGALQAGSKSATFEVAGVSPAFATVATDDRFLLVGHDQLVALAPDLLGSNPPDTLFIAAPASAAASLSNAVAASPGLQLQGVDEVAQTLGQTPVSRAVGFGLAASALAAAFYAALAVAAAFVLAAAEQRTETAYLRVLGLARAQRLRLVFVEHVPAALLAAVAGGALGVFVFIFIRPALGLTTILPESADITFSINPLQVAALLIAALLIVLPAWALAAFAQREPNPAAAVRETGA